MQTAVDGIGAAAAARRCAAPTDRLQEVARTGEPEAFRRALHAAEAAVIDAGQVAEIQVGGASALAAPLGASEERRPGDRHRVGRPRRPRVHPRRARAVRVLDQPGVGLGRERRPARDRAAPGGHRRAHRPVQPPPLPGGHVRRGRARPSLRARDGPDHARHRQLQAGQRHVRAPAGRPRAARGRARAAPVLARDRRARALRRRGDGRRAAADRPRGRVPVRRARAPARSRRSSSRCRRATVRCGSRRRSASPRWRPPTTPTRTRSWPPPTPRCTRPSAPARTAPCGRTGPFAAAAAFTASRPRSSLWAEAWDCSTTQSASTSSSSAGTGPIRDEVSRQENEALGATRRAEFARTGRGRAEAAADAACSRGAARPEPAAEAPPRRREPADGPRHPSRLRAGAGAAPAAPTDPRPRRPSRSTSRPLELSAAASSSRRAARAARRRAGAVTRRRAPTRSRPTRRSTAADRRAPARRGRARTSWRRRRTSSRRRPSTTGCGSSSARRATSTGTSSAGHSSAGRHAPFRPGADAPTLRARPLGGPPLVTPDRGAGPQGGTVLLPRSLSPLSGRLARHGPRGCRRAARSRL